MRWGDVIAGRHEPNAIPPNDAPTPIDAYTAGTYQQGYAWKARPGPPTPDPGDGGQGASPAPLPVVERGLRLHTLRSGTRATPSHTTAQAIGDLPHGSCPSVRFKNTRHFFHHVTGSSFFLNYYVTSLREHEQVQEAQSLLLGAPSCTPSVSRM